MDHSSNYALKSCRKRLGERFTLLDSVSIENRTGNRCRIVLIADFTRASILASFLSSGEFGF